MLIHNIRGKLWFIFNTTTLPFEEGGLLVNACRKSVGMAAAHGAGDGHSRGRRAPTPAEFPWALQRSLAWADTLSKDRTWASAPCLLGSNLQQDESDCAMVFLKTHLEPGAQTRPLEIASHNAGHRLLRASWVWKRTLPPPAPSLLPVLDTTENSWCPKRMINGARVFCMQVHFFPLSKVTAFLSEP